MAIQSNFIIFIFIGLAGLLLLGLIIFFVFYFSRSDKRGDVQKHTKPLAVKNVEELEVEEGEDTNEDLENTPVVVTNVEEPEVEEGEDTKEVPDHTPVVVKNVKEPEVEEGEDTKEVPDNTPLDEKNVEEPEVKVGKDMKEGSDHTPLVRFGRLVSDDRFAVCFEDKWITDPAKLSFSQKNRLEKNLAEAQRWLGIEANQVEEVPNTASKPFKKAIVPPLVPEKVIEKHKRQMSIVEQVDDILQGLLESSPMAETQIRLTEMPNKGVIVWVGKEYFEGIEAVPDEDVKQIIRQAVKKWEEVTGT